MEELEPELETSLSESESEREEHEAEKPWESTPLGGTAPKVHPDGTPTVGPAPSLDSGAQEARKKIREMLKSIGVAQKEKKTIKS